MRRARNGMLHIVTALSHTCQITSAVLLSIVPRLRNHVPDTPLAAEGIPMLFEIYRPLPRKWEDDPAVSGSGKKKKKNECVENTCDKE